MLAVCVFVGIKGVGGIETFVGGLGGSGGGRCL